MTLQDAIKVLSVERECVKRQLCDRECGKCDLAMDSKDILETYDYILSLLKFMENIK